MEKLLNNPIVKEVFKLFEDHEIYIVGGAIRDTILGREVSDIDFATNLLPDDIEGLAKEKGYKTIAVGKSFGTIRIMIQKQDIQVTTYRKKEQYKENNRNPEVEYGRIVEEDLQRRDFTINAMAINNKKFADPFNGKKDLEVGVLRTPQQSNKTFKDDPLRMIRAIRFVSKYGFKIEEKTYKGIISNANRVLSLSAERITMELDKLLQGDYIEEALQLLLDSRILNFIIPELTILSNIKQDEQFHHKNVWEHTKMVVKNSPKDMRWAALFHDIAKPYTMVVDTRGIHFYHHEEVGANMAQAILHRLKFSNVEKDKIVFIIRNHMRPNLYNENWSDRAVRRFKKDMGEYLASVIAMSKADITSQHPQRIQTVLDRLGHLEERCKQTPEPIIKCPIDGHIIMKEFNLSEGKQIGALKAKLLEAIEEGSLSEEGSVEYYLQFIERILNEDN